MFIEIHNKLFEEINILNVLMEKVKYSNEITKNAKPKIKGYMGMAIELINHIIDRTEKNDDILRYCESSFIF
jgi:hypothetical protein